MDNHINNLNIIKEYLHGVSKKQISTARFIPSSDSELPNNI
jgi:hypothetical protein